MSFSSQSGRLNANRNRGVALVLVLSLLVLIVVVTVAFFSRVTMERSVSNASASGTKVEMMAGTALDIITDDLIQEIVSNSTANGTGTNTIYVPKTGTNVMPIRSGTLANLIRYSSRNDSATRAAAALSTGTSLNGRSVNVARWNAHFLLPLANGTAGDSTPDNSFTAPDWVVVTRSGPTSGAAWNKNLSDSTSDQCAIGRYAYAIYNEGGLLDINAAGYPSSSSASQYGPKGGLAYADLTQLTFTKTQIDQIVGWRNYATLQPSGTMSSFTFDTAAAARYQTLVTSSTNAFVGVSGTSVYNGNTDHSFVNRQQLIKLLQSIATNSTEQRQFETALQYLGTFSREVNGPTCTGTGASATDYNPPYIFSVKVQSAFTRNNGTQAVAGEPLVKYRFPLEKLALLEKLGTVGLSTQDVDDIQRYFGLDVMSDSNGLFRHWRYPTTSTKYKHTDPHGIMSLSDVAGQNREADFFELLQAGISYGSVGRGGARGDVLVGTEGYTSANFQDPDLKVTLQLLRIGANIIDQWDADNYPTTITLIPPGSSATDANSVYGIEDLPYLNKFLFTLSGPGNYTTPYTQQNIFKYCFNLWNPHQALASNTGAYPTQFQISPLENSSNDNNSDHYMIGAIASLNSVNYRWYWDANGGSWTTTGTAVTHFAKAPGNGVISFSLASPATDYRSPTLSSTLSLNPVVGFPPDTMSTTTGTTSVTWSQAVAQSATMMLKFSTSMVYRIQYKDPGGTYRTYGTFVGLDNSNSPYPGTGYRQAPWVSILKGSGAVGWYLSLKSDPRTSRFGSGGNTTYISTAQAAQTLTPDASTVNGPITSYDPFVTSGLGYITSGTTPYRVDMWAVNSSSGGPPGTNAANPAYPDNDGQTRPGDAFYSYSSASPLFTSTSGTAARPVILNRPFRSVGELGYAYRDMPWKTLDFFSASSADAGLLDLFSLNGTQTVRGGRLNPNTLQKNVLAAVISGATQASSGTGTTVSSANAGTVATALISLEQTKPFANRSDLVARLMVDSSLSSLSLIKTEREAVIRALADSSNTRTWNLLVDLVAQVGKYPTTASSLDQFNVEGERHYWLHLAIDRYTGKVIDKQLEVVRE